MKAAAATPQTAQVLSYEEARARFADRVAARSRRNKERAKREAEACADRAAHERRYWLAEIEEWPPPFREAARPRIIQGTEPERVFHSDFGATVFRRCREDRAAREGIRFRFEDRIWGDLDDLRGAARLLREAKAKGRAGWITRRRRELKAAKRRLLSTLWLYGAPKILRTEFESYACERIAEELESLPRWIKQLRSEARPLRRRLRGGVYELGPKKGQPLSAAYREQIRRKLQRCIEVERRDRARLEYLTVESDPLRAWRLYV